MTSTGGAPDPWAAAAAESRLEREARQDAEQRQAGETPQPPGIDQNAVHGSARAVRIATR